MSRAGLRICGLGVAAAIGLGACNQGDSGNVMAPGGNSLTPAQVDAALGPELANGPPAGLNEAGAADDVGQAPPAAAEQQRRQPAAPRPSPRAESNPPAEPEEQAADEPPANTGGNEQ